MALTEEQRKRMEDNRKRAMEIRKRRELEKNAAAEGFFAATTSPQTEGVQQTKKRKVDGLAESERDNNREPTGSKEDENIAEKLDTQDDDESSLEEFEVNASQYVSQTELQRVYLLPKGTIDVMSFIEKDNPHKRGWNKMKLYSRSDARRRARKRFGGKEGLIAERENRKRKKFENELKEVRKMS
jgi:DNA-repair protein complementing XP-A cells